MLKLPQPFRKQGQQLCSDGNTTVFFDAYNVDQMHDAYQQGLAAQPEPCENAERCNEEGSCTEGCVFRKQAQPARPINCGTGHCSCIECPYEQAQPEQPSKYGSPELQALILDKLQQAQPERAGLTEAEVTDIAIKWSNSRFVAMSDRFVQDFAREILAAEKAKQGGQHD